MLVQYVKLVSLQNVIENELFVRISRFSSNLMYNVCEISYIAYLICEIRFKIRPLTRRIIVLTKMRDGKQKIKTFVSISNSQKEHYSSTFPKQTYPKSIIHIPESVIIEYETFDTILHFHHRNTGLCRVLYLQ